MQFCLSHMRRNESMWLFKIANFRKQDSNGKWREGGEGRRDWWEQRALNIRKSQIVTEWYQVSQSGRWEQKLQVFESTTIWKQFTAEFQWCGHVFKTDHTSHKFLYGHKKLWKYVQPINCTGSLVSLTLTLAAAVKSDRTVKNCGV